MWTCLFGEVIPFQPQMMMVSSFLTEGLCQTDGCIIKIRAVVFDKAKSLRYL